MVYLGNQWSIPEPPACSLLLHCIELRRLHNAVKEEKEKSGVPRYFLLHLVLVLSPSPAALPPAFVARLFSVIHSAKPNQKTQTQT
jgi:hypothetical protein